MDLSTPVNPLLAFGVVWGTILLAGLVGYIYLRHSRREREREAHGKQVG